MADRSFDGTHAVDSIRKERPLIGHRKKTGESMDEGQILSPSSILSAVCSSAGVV
jgi:hypothetical protein